MSIRVPSAVSASVRAVTSLPISVSSSFTALTILSLAVVVSAERSPTSASSSFTAPTRLPLNVVVSCVKSPTLLVSALCSSTIALSISVAARTLLKSNVPKSVGVSSDHVRPSLV